MTINEAIILTGGEGSRIQGYTGSTIPKGMVEIMGKPLLYWCVNWLAKYGVRRVIMAVGHLSEVIQSYFGDVISIDNIRIEIIYSLEKEKLGSGGAVKLASQYVVGEDVIIMNGDVLSDIDLGPMIKRYINSNLVAMMLLVKLRSRFGIVEFQDGLITQFKEKPELPHYIHAGMDIMKTELLSRFPDKGQMEDTIFVELANEGRFRTYTDDGEYFWEAIDTPKELKEANKHWKGL